MEVALSGVLVAVLVVVWAVVLVPMWVHRHDDETPEISLPGSRVIPRRRDVATSVPAGERRYAVRPRVAPARVRPRRSARAMLRRRRIVVGVAVCVVVVTLVAGIFGAVPLVGGAVPLLAFAGYVASLRRSAVTAAAGRRRRQRREAARRAAGFRDFPPAAVPTTMTAPAPVPPAPVAASPMATPVARIAPPPLADPLSPAAEARPVVGGEPWTPVRVPLPSYVTAAPAPRVVDGDWHEEDLVEGELPGDAAAYALEDEAVERRRAVGD